MPNPSHILFVFAFYCFCVCPLSGYAQESLPECEAIPYAHNNMRPWLGSEEFLIDNIETSQTNAIKCLARIPSPKSKKILLESLQNENPERIIQALEALIIQKDGDACPQIPHLLSHKNSDIIKAAAQYAGKMLCYEASQALLQATHHRDIPVRIAALHALQFLPHPNTIPEILPLLEQDDETSRAAIKLLTTTCMITLDDLCLSYLTDKLYEDSTDIRISAARALKKLADSRTFSQLLGAFRREPDPSVRFELLLALRALEDSRAQEALLAMLDETNIDDIQMLIIRSLSNKKANSQLIISRLLELSNNNALQPSAQEALQNLGFQATQALTEELQTTTNPEKILFILQTLATLPGLYWTDTYHELILFEDKYLEPLMHIFSRIQASQAEYYLRAFAPQLPNHLVADLLPSLANSENDVFIDIVCERFEEAVPRIQLEFLKYLQKIPNLKAAPKLLEIARGDNDIKLRKYAILALKNALSDQTVQNALLDFLNHPLPHIQAAAADALLHYDGSNDENNDAYAKNNLDLRQKLFQQAQNGNPHALRSLAFLVRELDDQNTQEYVSFAQSILKDLSNPLAESALELLLTRKINPQISLEQYKNARSSLRIKIITCWVLSNNGSPADLITEELNSSNLPLHAQALWAIGELKLNSENIQKALIKDIQKAEPCIAINAMRAAGRLELRNAQKLLEIRLHDVNPKVAHNALWALQKLKQLPTDTTLKNLYRQTQASHFKQYLGKLTKQIEVNHDISETTNLKENWYLIDLQTDDTYFGEKNLTIWMPDNSLYATFSDAYGKIRLENVTHGRVYPIL